MNITDICIRRPVLAWMLMGATLLFGLLAFQRIGISQFPDVDFPTINVAVSLEGAAPEVIEHDVIEILEEAISQVEGVRSVTSVARQGNGDITVELELSRPVDAALQDVQARVGQVVRRLPREMDAPVVSKTNPEDNPIMWVGLSGPYPQKLISDIARYRVKEKLQTLSGVGEVMMGGYLERNVRIWLDATRLDEFQLTASDVVSALRRSHVELPAGMLDTEGREVNVRVMGEAVDLETLRNVVLRKDNAAIIYLHQVALVEDGFEDVRRLARVNGQPAQGMGIKKQRGANAVAVAKEIKKALSDIRPTLPEGMELGINFDSTQYIEESVHDLQLEILLAVLLTALVCWAFLGSWSSTLNVVLAIPMSLFGTVAVIYFLGFTLNTFTLLGLALAVGIVVDDAIMVMENIFRHREEGKDSLRAAQEGTQQIKFAALAATLAVVAIFLPVVFMQGVVGRFFLQFGITLCLAVMFSYVEAITLAPSRCAQMLNVSTAHRSKVGQAVDAAFKRLEAKYAKSLSWVLKHPWQVLAFALAFTGLAVWLLLTLPTEFVPSQDQSRLMVRLQTAVGSDLEESDRLIQKAEAFVQSRPEVVRQFTVVGGFGGAGVNGGVMFLTLLPPSQRSLTQNEFAAALRKELNGYAGLRALVLDLSQSGFTAQRGFPVEFSVRGADWESLVKTSEALTQKLRQSGLLLDLDTDYKLGMPELRILPDRQRAADVGVSMEDIATALNTQVGGIRVGKYSSQGRRMDVRMRLLSSQRARPEDLARLKVRNSQGQLIPLSSLTSNEELPALQAITRKDRERAITFFANIAPGHAQGEVLAEIEKMGSALPEGERIVLSGSSVAFRESMGSLYFALVMGIVVAYMVLASQFNSFIHPVTVLSILPLSLAGAALALFGTGSSLNLFSLIGLLLLMGIVKKNSIILIDYATQLLEEGKSAMEAMAQAGPTRLRPILMTSIATMMAAIPSALALGAGAEVKRPMAIAVLGGMLLATLLSLAVVPAFFVVLTQRKTSAKGV